MMAAGLAGSLPLTWHVVLRLVRTGRDHVHDLRGAAVGRTVGLFCCVHWGCGLAGEVTLLFPPCLLKHVGLLAHQS